MATRQPGLDAFGAPTTEELLDGDSSTGCETGQAVNESNSISDGVAAVSVEGEAPDGGVARGYQPLCQ